MRRVDLQHLEPRCQRILRCHHERLDQALDLIDAQGARQALALLEGDGRGRHSLPAALVQGQLRAAEAAAAALAACVPNLDAGHGARLNDALHDGLPRRHMLGAPQTRAARGDAALRHHTRGLADHKTHAARCTSDVVHLVKLMGHAVLRRVHAHRTHSNTVLELDGAQLVGLEKQRL